MAYIPNKLYCGFKSESSDSLVAFMTPMAEDSAFAKRKSSVDSWRDNNLQTLELDNTPMLGFRFVDTSRRWNSNNVVFRVIHPGAGAEFEISAENLCMLMETCDIIKGEITTKLLLIRDGSKNVLVPENSTLHLGAAKVDAKGREIYVDKSLVKVGSAITVKSYGKVVNFDKEQIHTVRVEVKETRNSLNQSYSYGMTRYYDFIISERTINEFIMFDEKSKIVKTLTTRPKVLALEGQTSLTKDDLIGKSYLYYGEHVYAYGDISTKQFKYELVKFDPTTESHNHSYIILKTNTGEMHIGSYNKWHKRFDSFGEVVFDENSGELLPKNGNFAYGTPALVLSGDYYYIAKVEV
ncbi:hypothetical protein XaC1_144 [Xanthomonas phage XaC1]|nr:hypothetical protein XaC1_144 [Xanthomonas phage XaC1]